MSLPCRQSPCAVDDRTWGLAARQEAAALEGAVPLTVSKPDSSGPRTHHPVESDQGSAHDTLRQGPHKHRPSPPSCPALTVG